MINSDDAQEPGAGGYVSVNGLTCITRSTVPESRWFCSRRLFLAIGTSFGEVLPLLG